MSAKPHFVGRVRSKGADTEVRGRWINHFKRPCSIQIVTEQKSSVEEADDVVIQGDRFYVWYVLAAFAEIAWNMGWRPASLVGQLDQVIKKHQIPNATKRGNDVEIGEPPAPKPTRGKASKSE